MSIPLSHKESGPVQESVVCFLVRALYTPNCNICPPSHEGFEVWIHSHRLYHFLSCLLSRTGVLIPYTHLIVIWAHPLTYDLKYCFIPSMYHSVSYVFYQGPVFQFLHKPNCRWLQTCDERFEILFHSLHDEEQGTAE